MDFTKCQIQAITDCSGFLSNPTQKYFLLTGSGGTGKTTVVKHIVESMEKINATNDLMDSRKPIQDVVYCALTHKAAGILSDMVDEPVSTVHSLFALMQGYDRETGDKFFYKSKTRPVGFGENTLVICDEVSMLSDELFKLMVKELPKNCVIIFIGDSHQVPPVGFASSPIFNMGFPNANLLEPVRFNNQELLDLNVEMRKAIDEQRFPKFIEGKRIRKVNNHEFERLMILANKQGLNCKTISWTNAKVKYFADLIHRVLFGNIKYNVGQQLLSKKRIQTATGSIINTQTVITITQPPQPMDIILGDTTVEITRLETSEGTITIPVNRAKAVKALKYLKTERKWAQYNGQLDKLADVISPYSITAHQSQSSTYSTVFIDLPDIMRNKKFDEMLRILYVAVSRASDEVIFLG